MAGGLRVSDPAFWNIIQNGDVLLSAVARGMIDGMSIMSKFGVNPEIDSGNTADVWQGPTDKFVPPDGAQLLYVSSTSAQDAGTELRDGTATGGSNTTLVDTTADFTAATAVSAGDFVINDTQMIMGRIVSVAETVLTIIPGMSSPKNGRRNLSNREGDVYRVVTSAGTGASFIHMSGLDQDLLDNEEFVILNGATPVVTARDYFDSYRARSFCPGDPTDTAGVVSIIALNGGDPDTTVIVINDGDNQTRRTIFTMPINEVGYIYNWRASIAKTPTATAEAVLRVGEVGGTMYVLDDVGLSTAGVSAEKIPFKNWRYIPGGAGVLVDVKPSANDVIASAGFGILRVDQELDEKIRSVMAR